MSIRIITIISIKSVKSELSVQVFMHVWECGGFRTHWAAVPVAFGCSLALARPETATVPASACRYAGSVLWPRSPDRTLWMGWHRRTPRFHSEWSTEQLFVPPLANRKKEMTHEEAMIFSYSPNWTAEPLPKAPRQGFNPRSIVFHRKPSFGKCCHWALCDITK